ncbi:MAG: uroporphyrinogen-III synthase [Halioglobus sp.]
MAAKSSAPAVLVTRPAGPASDGLCALLLARGYRTHSQPLLELHAAQELTPAQRRLVADLDQYQHVVFISANAARFGLDCLQSSWPQWPPGLHWYAIGDATARLLSAQGIRARVPGEEMTSEGLLALPALQQLDEHRILIVKGEGGRDALLRAFTERGAQVDELACYRRECPQLAAGELAARLQRWQPAAVLISSGEGLENFTQLLRPAESTTVGATYMVVPSDRVARMAQEMGFRNICIAKNASDAAMIRALEECVPPAVSRT